MKNVLAAITSYKATKAQADALQKQAEKLKAELMDYIKSKECNTIVVGQYTLTITECVKRSLDEKAIREQFPDVAQATEKTTVYERFTVK